MKPRESDLTPSVVTDAGFEVGWDYAHYRLVPPIEQLVPGNPVRAGWEAGRGAFGVRTLKATIHVRKWLQLRLGAWTRGKAFELGQVNPSFLKRIDVGVCPITGDTLTRCSGSDTDASVDRVNNQAGYAAGNLAVMSVRANRAKSAYGWREAAGFVRQIEVRALASVDRLTAREWARLATLMSFCTPLDHAEAALLPLLVLPPPGLRVLNPVQAVQAGLTACFARKDHVPKVDALVRLFPGGVQQDVRTFTATVMARRIGAGSSATVAQLQATLEAAWADRLLLRRWQRVALRMTPSSCESVASALPAAAGGTAGIRFMSLDDATDGWALETGGLVSPPSTAARHATTRPSSPPRASGSGRYAHPSLPAPSLVF